MCSAGLCRVCLLVACRVSHALCAVGHRVFWVGFMHRAHCRPIPDICHGRHRRRPCKFFLAGVNFYRFNAKNWHFRQILREKVAFFYRFNAKNWRFFSVNFIHQNFCPCTKMTNIRYGITLLFNRIPCSSRTRPVCVLGTS